MALIRLVANRLCVDSASDYLQIFAGNPFAIDRRLVTA